MRTLWLLLVAGCQTAHTPASAGPILIGVEQDGCRVLPVNGRVTLRRAPFTLLVDATDTFLIHASETPDTVRSLPESDDLEDFPGFRETGMAEAHANEGRELVLSADSPHCWYAEADGHHRYDEAPLGGVGRRTVFRVRFKGEGRSFELADYPFDALHLAAVRNLWLRTSRPPNPGLEVFRGSLRVATRKDSLTIAFR